VACDAQVIVVGIDPDGQARDIGSERRWPGCPLTA
jgi:hypothetical protein